MQQQSYSLEPSDRRASPRVDARNASFSVRAAERGVEIALADFNEEGFGVLVSAPTVAVQGKRLSLVARSQGQDFARMELEVANVLRCGASWRVGGRLVDVVSTIEAGRANVPLADALAPGETDVEIGDSQMYSELLAAISLGPLSARVEGTTAAGTLAGACAGGLRLELGRHAAAFPVGLEIAVIVQVYGATFVLRGKLGARSDGGRLLEAPLRIYSRARRRCDRVAVSEGEVFLSWPFALVPGKRVLAKVVELSATGARVRLARRATTFPPLPSMAMALHVTGGALAVQADVRHVLHDGDEYVIGMSLAFSTRDDEARVARHLERSSYPELRPRSDVPPASVLALMEGSGYLALRESAQIAPMHAASNEQLSVDAVAVADDGSPAGHMSCTRVYSQTWMYHQLAAVGQGPAAMRGRRALYLSMTEWVGLLAGTTGFSIAYFDRAKRWHRRFFESFVEFVRCDDLAMIAPLDRFEWSGDAADEAAVESDVGAPTPSELEEVAAWARRALPGIMIGAMDLQAERLHTEELCAPHGADGLERARTVIVARDGGRAVAAALCETGSPTISLFNILNMAHLLIEPDASPEARRALLRAVRAHYLARGTPRPLIVARPGTLTDEPSLALVETMGCMLISSAGLPHYRNFLRAQFGPAAQVSASPGG